MKGKVLVLDDALFRALHVVTNKIETPEHHLRLELLNIAKNSESDQFFGPFYKGLQRKLPGNDSQQARLYCMLDDFNVTNGLLYYQGKLHISRHNNKEILRHAHDSSVSDRFSHGKTLERLHGFYWRMKTNATEANSVGFLFCQMSKDGSTKHL